MSTLLHSRPGLAPQMQRKGKLGRGHRAGYGVYAQSRTLTDEPPARPKVRKFESSAVVAYFLRNMGVDPKPGLLVREYDEGCSTQGPPYVMVDAGKSRIRRMFYGVAVQDKRP